MENVKALHYLRANYLNSLKTTFKSYFLLEIFHQKKEMSSFVL